MTTTTAAHPYELGARVYHPHQGFGAVERLYPTYQRKAQVLVRWDDKPWPTTHPVEGLRREDTALALGLTAPLPAEHNYQCERCLWRTDGLNTYLAHQCDPGLRALRTYQRGVGAL